MKNQAHTETKLCQQCKLAFLCGPSSKDGTCWCSSYPPIFKLNPDNECLCERCLHTMVVGKINKLIATIDPDQAREIDLSKYQTEKNIEGIDYYIEEGNYVFTKWYHLKRGHCCESGCRHCPFGVTS